MAIERIMTHVADDSLLSICQVSGAAKGAWARLWSTAPFRPLDVNADEVMDKWDLRVDVACGLSMGLELMIH